MTMRSISRFLLLAAALAVAVTGAAWANEVTDWNQIMFQAALAASPPTSPLTMTRVSAIGESSVFAAVTKNTNSCVFGEPRG